MVPGRILHRLAKRLCSAKVLERMVEPAIADLQSEHLDAVRDGRAWYGRWILFAGYVGFVKAGAMCGLDCILGNSLNVGDERRVLRRTLVWSASLIVVMTAVLLVPPLQFVPADARGGFTSFFLAALIPQALPLAIPVGLTLGVLVSFHGQSMTRGHRGRVLILAVACALVSFITLSWIMPSTNQAFRVRVAQAKGLGYPMKGENEMTLRELSREIRTAAASGLPSRARVLAFTYHLRWSLPGGVIALALFASAVSKQGIVLRVVLGVLACGLYWASLWVGDDLVGRQSVPAFVGAWIPNVLLIGASFAVVNLRALRGSS